MARRGEGRKEWLGRERKEKRIEGIGMEERGIREGEGMEGEEGKGWKGE